MQRLCNLTNSRELLVWSPTQLISKSISTAFDSKAKCPSWRRFVEQVFNQDEELISFVQKAIGYTLTGHTTERALFFAWGIGKNGKSTLISTIQSLLGDYAVQAPPNLLVAKRNETHPTEIMRLRGARLVVASETEDQCRLSEGLVKQLTGGSDKLSARGLYRDFEDFSPTHKIWLSSNHKPIIRETTEAIWDRLRLIPFTQRFDPPDKALPERLIGELPGILTWAVEGCLAWQQQGSLGTPRAVKRATNSYRKEMDVLGTFIDEKCEAAEGSRILGDELYKLYSAWSERAGEKTVARKELYKALEERGFQKQLSNGTRFKGLRIKAK